MKRKHMLPVAIASALLILTLGGCSSPQAAVSETKEAGSESNDNNTQSADVVGAIMNTYSSKEFTDEPVADEDLERILLTGTKAPSARNSQSWYFTVVRNEEVASAFAASTTAGTVAIVISGITEAEEGINVDFDCALAVENMYIAAQSLGLGAHIYTAPVRSINEEHREVLEIPEGYEAVALLVIGNVENQADAVASASQRNDLADIVNYIE